MESELELLAEGIKPDSLLENINEIVNSFDGAYTLAILGNSSYYKKDYLSAEEYLKKSLGSLLILWEQNKSQKVLYEIAYVSSKLSSAMTKLNRSPEDIKDIVNLSISSFEKLNIDEHEKNVRLALLYKKLGENSTSDEEKLNDYLTSYDYFKKIDYENNYTLLLSFMYLCTNLSRTYKKEPEKQIKYLKEEIDAIEKIKKLELISPRHESYARIMLGSLLIKNKKDEAKDEIKENYKIGINLLERSLEEHPPETTDYWDIRKKIVTSSRIFSIYLYSIGEDNKEYLEKVVDYGYTEILMSEQDGDKIHKAVMQASYFLWRLTGEEKYKEINSKIRSQSQI